MSVYIIGIGFIIIALFPIGGIMHCLYDGCSELFRKRTFLIPIIAVFLMVCYIGWFVCVTNFTRRQVVDAVMTDRLQIDTLAINPKTGEVLDWDYSIKEKR